MAVVIRLQGLPVSAGSADIRHFFTGLTVPDGGVHIIGGEFGEAFIIFSTDDDARRAMNRSGGFIKQSKIQLYLSSKSEMQSTIEMNRNKGRTKPGIRGYGSAVPGATGDNFSNLMASIKGINKTGPIPSQSYSQGGREAKPFDSDEIYLFLQGLPYSAEDEEVRTFFNGLHVNAVIFLQHRSGPYVGRKNGNSLVKFATRKDALEGLKRHKQYMGSRFIEISQATKAQWKENSDFLAKGTGSSRIQHGDQSSSREQNSVRSKSPKDGKARSPSPGSLEFYIHIKNMSNIVDKKDIKSFFENLEISDNQIKFLYNSFYRTKDGFIQFKNEKDYRTALGLHKQILKNRMVYIYPIGRKSMMKLLEKPPQSAVKGQPAGEYMPGNRFQDASSNSRLYVYVRNFPFDVSKSEVQKFFVGFSLNEDDVYLLYDDKGVGLGEAVVMFHSEEFAAHAENLNHRRFLGTEVLLQRISEGQVKEFGINPFPGESTDKSRGHGMNQYSHSGNFRAPDDFRYGPEESRAPPKYFRGPNPRMDFGGNRFATRNNGIEGNPEKRMRYDYDYDDDCNSMGPTRLRIINIPFTSTVNEILDFFYGYHVIPDSVSIQYNENGLPAGIATLAMESADEAFAAVQELNDRPVGPRRVKLSII